MKFTSFILALSPLSAQFMLAMDAEHSLLVQNNHVVCFHNIKPISLGIALGPGMCTLMGGCITAIAKINRRVHFCRSTYWCRHCEMVPL
jgi:hypothetical protein